jgi:hypothetical protein
MKNYVHKITSALVGQKGQRPAITINKIINIAFPVERIPKDTFLGIVAAMKSFKRFSYNAASKPPVWSIDEESFNQIKGDLATKLEALGIDVVELGAGGAPTTGVTAPAAAAPTAGVAPTPAPATATQPAQGLGGFED